MARPMRGALLDTYIMSAVREKDSIRARDTNACGAFKRSPAEIAAARPGDVCPASRPSLRAVHTTSSRYRCGRLRRACHRSLSDNVLTCAQTRLPDREMCRNTVTARCDHPMAARKQSSISGREAFSSAQPQPCRSARGQAQH